MPISSSSSTRSGVRATLKRRGGPFLVALGLLLSVAVGVYGMSGEEAGLVRGRTPVQPTYTVSLVSQAATQETSSDVSLSVADVAERANAAVVTIYTFIEGGQSTGPFPSAAPDAASSGDATPLGAGSGWILTDDGYVVTNAHVVQGADTFTVQYFDGTQAEADLVGTDAFQDVAVLKLVLDEGETVPGVSTLGDSSAVRPGDEVVAIGSPLGEFTNSVSDGNIGGLDRSLDTGNGSSLDNLIQHDAEISPGNSGGPLLNMQGEVIGMNVAKVETAGTGAGTSGVGVSGLNFAIDGNTVVEIAETIIANGGSIVFPYLGVQTQMTDDGPVVVAVEPGGPAAEAGIAEGDIVRGIDDVEIDGDTGLTQALFEHEPGDTVTMTLARGGNAIELDVTLGERPENL